MPAPDQTPAPGSGPEDTPRPGARTGGARRYRRIYLIVLICYWVTAEAVAAEAGAAASAWLGGYGRLVIWLLVAALVGLSAGQFDTQFADAHARRWFQHRQDPS